MLQPFELFKPLYIDRLAGLKKRYLVSQSYSRGFNHLDDEQKTTSYCPIMIFWEQRTFI